RLSYPSSPVPPIALPIQALAGPFSSDPPLPSAPQGGRRAMEKRSIASAGSRPTAVRWFKRWCLSLSDLAMRYCFRVDDSSNFGDGCSFLVALFRVPQDVVATGGKCHLLKWVTAMKLQAFSLDFNLKSHMKTHSLENYHVCPYPECGKKYTHESKLKSHLKAHHEKVYHPAYPKSLLSVATVEMAKRKPSSDKPHNTTKSAATAYVSVSAERRFACPYEGCVKAYIHEYKLNLHLRKEHPGHNRKSAALSVEQAIDEPSNQDAYTTKGGGFGKNSKRCKPNLTPLMPPAKLPKLTRPNLVLLDTNTVKKHMQTKEMYEEDSQETEERLRQHRDG
ncbi:hypothetical protein GW17_00031572, partial [Ensete ventricosum]